MELKQWQRNFMYIPPCLTSAKYGSQLQDCLEDVLKLLLEFLLGFEEGVLLGFTHWCFGNVGRGSHVEVVKGVI